ncbi:ATP-dependent permease MDL1 [Gossypium arboreum]|uniref:ATP-dependent permease MDL1 n=1 Tax=Gossypium arboreum TaxID=29729 RepID=A0A0B0N9Y5_GOSAR|nr:ATP-dependent permease MDL1 [Gossypium arboreum]
MESRLRPGKEQDFRLNRINCPYFVPSIAKLARGSKDIRDSITLSIGLLGIVSLNNLSMACIGTWSFCSCVILIWPSMLAYNDLVIHFVYGHEIWFILIIGL